MRTTLPPTKSRITQYPLKDPERCPHCNSRRLIRKGTRKKKLESVPLWRCKSCGRTFTPGPRPIRNKTYPIDEILEAITLFDRGFTLQETAEKISSRFGRHASPSTISRWVSEHPQLTTYTRLRTRGLKSFKPTQTIRAIKLYHRQVYEFAYHRAKLGFLRDGTLDLKRSSSTSSTARFDALADFLESIPQTCPYDLFSREDGARSSQVGADFFTPDNLVVTTKENAATEMAGLVLPAVGTNHERHPKLQRFMLANDSTTIAVEVPVWLTANDIAAIEKKYGTRLLSGHGKGSITGHIDILQVRNGAVHILDYKPDARTNRPIAQLTIYALALAHRTGLKLFDIKYAWFKNEYCEFFPRKLFTARDAIDPMP